MVQIKPIRLFVYRERLLRASLLQATDAPILDKDLVDFWYQKPTVVSKRMFTRFSAHLTLSQGMDNEWMKDVMFLHADHSKTFYELTDKPGKMRKNKNIKDANKRALGVWRRMPRVSHLPSFTTFKISNGASQATVKTIVRCDELTIAARSKGPGVISELVKQEVHMVGWDPDHPL